MLLHGFNSHYLGIISLIVCYMHVGFGIWLACVEHCYVLCLAANVSGYSQSQRTYSDGAIGSRTELRSYGSIA